MLEYIITNSDVLFIYITYIMNKIIFFLITIMMFTGCYDSENIWDEKENVGYIDYSTLPVNKLSSEDKILLKNIDFQRGKYVCALSKEGILAKGVSEKRYQFFLEYLENQNAILAEYIKDGATVTFGNKSFGPKGEFIEEVLPEFGKSANLLSRSVGDFQAAQGIIVPGSSNNIISFKAFYRISISGIGKEMSHWTVFLIEPYKGLRRILSGTSSLPTTTYVQTASSDTFVDWDWQGECVDIVRSNPTLTVNSNIRGVELTFNTSKDWNYNVTFNPVLPNYIIVKFNKNLLWMEAKDQNPEGINWIYYAEIYDNYSGILWHGTEIQYGHPINNFPVPGDREITIYLSYARYDSVLGKYVADRFIAQQEFYVPREW